MVKSQNTVLAPVKNGRDKMITGITKEDLISRLKRWVPSRYHDINDFETIIDRAELVEDKYWAFDCSFQTVYLDKDNFEPVNYKEQHIIDENYYYDYNTSDDGAGTYTYINSLKKKGYEQLMQELGSDIDE